MVPQENLPKLFPSTNLHELCNGYNPDPSLLINIPDSGKKNKNMNSRSTRMPNGNHHSIQTLEPLSISSYNLSMNLSNRSRSGCSSSSESQFLTQALSELESESKQVANIGNLKDNIKCLPRSDALTVGADERNQRPEAVGRKPLRQKRKHELE